MKIKKNKKNKKKNFKKNSITLHLLQLSDSGFSPRIKIPFALVLYPSGFSCEAVYLVLPLTFTSFFFFFNGLCNFPFQHDYSFVDIGYEYAVP